MSLQELHDTFSATEPPMLMRIEQVMNALQLSRRRVYQLIADGSLTRVKIGKACRVTRNSVVRLASAQQK